MSGLYDTDVLRDYLRGEPRSRTLFDNFPHGAVSVLTWLAIMREAPAGREEATRSFLRRFERLAINEAIADRALALGRRHPELTPDCALVYATAQINALTFVTASAAPSIVGAADVWVPYARR